MLDRLSRQCLFARCGSSAVAGMLKGRLFDRWTLKKNQCERVCMSDVFSSGVPKRKRHSWELEGDVVCKRRYIRHSAGEAEEQRLDVSVTGEHF